jgi:PAS domain S-box-containing protein
MDEWDRIHRRVLDVFPFPVRHCGSDAFWDYFGTCHDITELKEAEEQLATRQAHLKEVHALGRFGDWYWDIPTGTLAWSDELYRVFGVTPEEFSPTHDGFPLFLHPDDRTVFESAVEAALRSRQRYQCELRIRRADGGLRVLLTSGRIDFDKTRKPVRMFGTAFDITEKKEVEKALQEANAQLRIISQHLLETQENQRRHLARELHDEIGQRLTATKINLQLIQRFPHSKLAPQRLEESVASCEELLKQVRALSLELRPPLLDDVGLVSALRSYVTQQARRAGLTLHFTTSKLPARCTSNIEITCYRFVQEAVNNAVRHAGATSLMVDLRVRAGTIYLLVGDNGAGFDVEAMRRRALVGGSLGLLTMRERIELVGGTMEIESSNNRGTVIRASIPLTTRSSTPAFYENSPCTPIG